MDHTDFNRAAWDAIAASATQWFVPASREEIANARLGQPAIKVTAIKYIPSHWLSAPAGLKILCLAGGGGHQGPLLAATGAEVTVADFSSEQLALDRQVAERENLTLKTVQVDMRDFGDLGPFDCVLNPCSLNFCPDVIPVWREAYRVLKPGGILITGFVNPINYLFDPELLLAGKFVVTNSIPHAESPSESAAITTTSIPPSPAEYGHTLQDLIGGQIEAGFQIRDLFEDRWGGGDALSKKIAVFLATLATQP